MKKMGHPKIFLAKPSNFYKIYRKINISTKKSTSLQKNFWVEYIRSRGGQLRSLTIQIHFSAEQHA